MTTFSYQSRPAKHILRLLLAETCRQLTPIAPLVDYRYVGFGGIEFVDFEVFRRALGVNDMTSIEQDTLRQTRYAFNRPFSEIALLAGTASQRLPDIDWRRLAIVWLDYESQVVDEVLADVAFLCLELIPGSVLVITANASSPRPADQRRGALVTNVGEERVPPRTTDDSLARWGWAAAQRDVLLGLIDEELGNRRDAARFEQLFDFVYADDAPMQTLGGIVTAPGVDRAIELCRLDDLDFISRRGTGQIEVRVPMLTHREVLHLNAQLPLGEGGALQAEGIRDEELHAFERFYRWYPAAG